MIGRAVPTTVWSSANRNSARRIARRISSFWRWLRLNWLAALAGAAGACDTKKPRDPWGSGWRQRAMPRREFCRMRAARVRPARALTPRGLRRDDGDRQPLLDLEHRALAERVLERDLRGARPTDGIA